MNENRPENARLDAPSWLLEVRRLPQSIPPPRDLWPAIEATLDQPQFATRRAQGRAPWGWALAAALGCMALGGLLTYVVLQRHAAPPAATTALAARSVPAQLRNASFGGYAQLGPEYEQARASLIIGLAERLDRLPPQSRLKIERNLNELRRALGEINAALELEPDSRLLQELLMSTYQHELNLLANVNQMAGELPARVES